MIPSNHLDSMDAFLIRDSRGVWTDKNRGRRAKNGLLVERSKHLRVDHGTVPTLGSQEIVIGLVRVDPCDEFLAHMLVWEA